MLSFLNWLEARLQPAETPADRREIKKSFISGARKTFTSRSSLNMVKEISQNPEVAEKIRKYIPAGSTLHRTGSEAIVILTPQNTVIRITKYTPRYNVPELHKPIRQVVVSGYRIEELERAVVGHERGWDHNKVRATMPKIKSDIEKRGYKTRDWASDQFGFINNKVTLLDPGTIHADFPPDEEIDPSEIED